MHTNTPRWKQVLANNSIWFFAFGYFAFYVPYSLLIKLMTSGLLPGQEGVRLKSFEVLPVSLMASALGMLMFLTGMRWWKHAHSSRILGLRIPRPTMWTFLSGICTALIIATTTLSYTFEGVSIVFAMLLMRGGVLIIAPIVDFVSRRHVRWFSWAGLGFALLALLVSLRDVDSYVMPVLLAIDIAVYLAAYFIRLRLMSKMAKSEESADSRRYFVEEQMVAAPVMLMFVGIVALLGIGTIGEELRYGFTGLWSHPALVWVFAMGLCSQGTGVFGSLVFLDKRENTFCVPVNRSASVISGVIASFLLMLFGMAAPATTQLMGASFIVGAILFLSIPPMIAGRRAKRSSQ